MNNNELAAGTKVSFARANRVRAYGHVLSTSVAGVRVEIPSIDGPKVVTVPRRSIRVVGA